MGRLDINTDQIKAAGEEIKKIATDYSILLEEMYGKIDKLSASGIWASEKDNGSANIFKEKATKDKAKAMLLTNELATLANEIIDYAKAINSNSDNVI